jgi:hypothetical protein
MSTTFDINSKALQSMGTKPMSVNTIKAVFDGRTKSSVEACGANHTNVIGSFPEPSAEALLKDMPPISGRPGRTPPGVTAFSHGFMEAVHLSYAQHYPLILTPDSVWLTIAQGFGTHVNANAEALRKRFVQHEGKKMILIERDNFLKGSPDNDWQGCFNEFSDELAKDIGKKRDLIVSNFSTTGAIEKATSELVLMDSMKSYFKYAVRTLCGIPNVTLTGTVEDWRSIRTRAENLAEFDLDWWVKSLVPVLDHFVAAAEGNPDIKFWDNMYKQGGGSGGPYCSGWVNVLFPYLENYKGVATKNQYAELSDKRRGFGDGPTMDAYPSSLSKTPFKWQYLSTTYDMEFLGGVVGVHQHDDLSIEPAIGWAIRDQGSSKEGPIDPKEDW